MCEHGRQRSQCKECGGASICEHGRRRSNCKECRGTRRKHTEREEDSTEVATHTMTGTYARKKARTISALYGEVQAQEADLSKGIQVH